MKAKGKAKQLFCMVCVFVASFLLTVTAFAESAFEIQNSNYFGTYVAQVNSMGYVMVKEDIVRFAIYHHDTYGYLNGTAQHGFLTKNAYSFTISEATIVNNGGVPLGTKAYNVNATGTTTVKGGEIITWVIKSITLTPNGNTGEKYVLTK